MGRVIIFTPASLLLPAGGNGVRAVLPALALALRRGALVVPLWTGDAPEAGHWSREAFGGGPYIAAPRERWAQEIRRVAAGEGEPPLTVGVGADAGDLEWLYATALRYHAGPGEAAGVTPLPHPGPVAWRMAVEEALGHASS